MDGGIGEIPQLMQQMVSHLFYDLMAALNRESRIYCNIQLCMKPVPEPSHPYLGNVPYPRRMAYGVSDFPCDLRVHPVKHASKDGFAGFPYNPENGKGNQQAHDGVRQGIAQPNPQSPKENGQTGIWHKKEIAATKEFLFIPVPSEIPALSGRGPAGGSFRPIRR
jgi:hypothetical protein